MQFLQFIDEILPQTDLKIVPRFSTPLLHLPIPFTTNKNEALLQIFLSQKNTNEGEEIKSK